MRHPLAPPAALSLLVLLGLGLANSDGRAAVDRHVPARASAPAGAAARVAQAAADDTPIPVLLGTSAPSPSPSPDAGRVIAGPMEQVLYAAHPSLARRAVVAQALGLFAHRLDLTRDLALGDRVRLVVHTRADGGESLDYAEWRGAAGDVRLYRRAPGDGVTADDFADASGGVLSHEMLRTPLDGAALASLRVTSAFGMRLHPLLGYSRLHAGVDFAAPVGTPVLAAADGTVAAARWAGGYGRMIRLAHAGATETVYAHLSSWAPGLTEGRAVRQGQVIGWTGASGLATGPHLHFEVRQDGRPIDPATAVSRASRPDAALSQAFAARKRAIDALLG